MAESLGQELEMIEQGQHFTPDPAPDGTTPPPINRYSFDPSDSDSVTGSITPQQVKDLDTPQHPILDDIDVTLRRKVSSCVQEGGRACKLQDDASCDTLGRVLFQI